MAEKDELLEARPLDSTEITEVIINLQTWINAQSILSSQLYLDYIEGTSGLGFCIKTGSGSIVEEDIMGNYFAEVIFYVYYKTNKTPDGTGLIYKPLNDLSEWLSQNDFTKLIMGTKRTPKEIIALKGPVDLSGRDGEGNTTFYSIYKLLFYQEAK